MNCYLIKNGNKYLANIKAVIAPKGDFTEVNVRIIEPTKSVLYSEGSYHWVLPTDLVPADTKFKRKNRALYMTQNRDSVWALRNHIETTSKESLS